MAYKYDILEISDRAKIDKENGNIVIDGCLGTFRNDAHTLISFPSVTEYLTRCSNENLDYTRILGPKTFASALGHWIFNKDYLEITKNKNIFTAATIGGTGAIYDIFKYFSDNDGAALVSDICWPNYFTIGKNTGLEIFSYSLFEEKRFNLSGLELALNEALKTHDHMLIVINDPCQNPTGYSLTNEEYTSIFSILDRYNNNAKSVDIIFDTAYIEFYAKKPLLYEFLKPNYKFNVYLAFSASKTFGIYGLRLGALLGFMKSKEEKIFVENSISDIARGSISSPNAQAIGTLTALFNSDRAVEKMRLNLVDEKTYLAERASKSIKIMKSNSIEFLPFDSGFFITIISPKNAYALCDQLEKMHIYLVPISDQLIRIAICSLSVGEIELIAKAIKNFGF